MDVLLETKRLILKMPTLADFDNLFALRSDPEVMKYIGTGAVQTPEQVKEFIVNAELYFDKYGFAFCSVFEKGTGNFIGQAGLFHLGFDVTQPEVELAYRLHKKYWRQGYATELANALINWGFDALSLPKIIAMVHPENEASRKVMEKAGMYYRGQINYKGTSIPRYEIINSPTEHSKIKLIPASLADYPIIQNMGRFYVYDMSEYLGEEKDWHIPEDGLYECINFKKYWQTDAAFPFLIRYGKELAGFAIIDKRGSDKKIDFNMAQFFILRKFKNRGIGRYVAYQCFDKFAGVWEVMVIPGNEGAYRF